jgi:hypothetical protein
MVGFKNTNDAGQIWKSPFLVSWFVSYSSRQNVHIQPRFTITDTHVVASFVVSLAQHYYALTDSIVCAFPLDHTTVDYIAVRCFHVMLSHPKKNIFCMYIYF